MADVGCGQPHDTPVPVAFHGLERRQVLRKVVQNV